MATLDQVVDAIIAEAVGEGDDGMAAVAWTMQNRANERGKSITDVVNGRAYSGLSDPGPAARRAQRDPALRAKVQGILNAVQTGAYPDPTGGATHYWAPKGMPGGFPGMGGGGLPGLPGGMKLPGLGGPGGLPGLGKKK